YSNMACLNPFAAQNWYNLIKIDINEALKLEQRIELFMQKFIRPLIAKHHFSPQACDRFMAVLGGWADVGETLRWPYKSVPKEFSEKIRPDASNLLPEFFKKY